MIREDDVLLTSVSVFVQVLRRKKRLLDVFNTLNLTGFCQTIRLLYNFFFCLLFEIKEKSISFPKVTFIAHPADRCGSI